MSCGSPSVGILPQGSSSGRSFFAEEHHQSYVALGSGERDEWCFPAEGPSKLGIKPDTAGLQVPMPSWGSKHVACGSDMSFGYGSNFNHQDMGRFSSMFRFTSGPQPILGLPHVGQPEPHHLGFPSFEWLIPHSFQPSFFSKTSHFPRGFWWFSRKTRIPGKNGHGSYPYPIYRQSPTHFGVPPLWGLASTPHSHPQLQSSRFSLPLV